MKRSRRARTEDRGAALRERLARDPHTVTESLDAVARDVAASSDERFLDAAARDALAASDW